MKLAQKLKEDFKSTWKLATFVALITWITAAAIRYFEMLFVTGSLASDLQGAFKGQGLAPYLGSELINWLSRLDINLIGFIVVWLGSFMLIFAGKLILSLGVPELYPLLGKKGSYFTKIYSIILYGNVIVFALLFFFANMFSWTIITATFLYYAYVSLVIGLLALYKPLGGWLAK